MNSFFPFYLDAGIGFARFLFEILAFRMIEMDMDAMRRKATRRDHTRRNEYDASSAERFLD